MIIFWCFVYLSNPVVHFWISKRNKKFMWRSISENWNSAHTYARWHWASMLCLWIIVVLHIVEAKINGTPCFFIYLFPPRSIGLIFISQVDVQLVSLSWKCQAYRARPGLESHKCVWCTHVPLKPKSLTQNKLHTIFARLFPHHYRLGSYLCHR
jgi:hypothetical protein